MAKPVQHCARTMKFFIDMSMYLIHISIFFILFFQMVRNRFCSTERFPTPFWTCFIQKSLLNTKAKVMLLNWWRFVLFHIYLYINIILFPRKPSSTPSNMTTRSFRVVHTSRSTLGRWRHRRNEIWSKTENADILKFDVYTLYSIRCM